MTLRNKTMAVIGLTIAALILLLYAASKAILLGSFADLEEHYSRRNVTRAVNALHDDVATLNATLRDWAQWDDTYAFIEDINEDYIQSNLTDETFITLKLNVILFVNRAGRVVFGKGFDLGSERETPVPDSLREHLLPDSLLLNHPDTESSVAGILVLPEGPMLVASRPILTSKAEGPIRGTMIMGRYLDAAEVQRLAEITRTSLDIQEVNDLHVYPGLAAPPLSPEEDSILVRPLDGDSIAGYAVLKDIYGNPGLVLRVDMPRAIYKQGQRAILYFILALLITGLAFGAVVLFLLERMVLSRLARLNEDVSRIGESGDLSERVSVTGADELAQLGSAINRMLASLERSGRELQESEERYRRLVELSPDAIAVYGEDGIVFANKAGVRLLGATSLEQIIGKSIRDVIHPECLPTVEQRVRELKEGKPDARLIEGKLVRLDGQVVDVEISSVPIIYDGKPALQVICRDVTERRQMEEKTRYLTFHDPVTGLYNRTFFEEEMRRLEDGRYNPVGIIVCDVDGLKLINDTLGHHMGDKLLVAAADVIRKCFREGDVVARVGGDEFAVLLPNTSRTAVENASDRIRKAVVLYNADNPQMPLNISVGFAVSSSAAKTMADLFKEADDNMYREKLRSNQSSRSCIVKALMSALEASDFITEGHAERMQDLVAALGAAIGLPASKITELRLLAQFHDIGKVGVADSILFKKDPLTADEEAEMRRHCEIGYRIAQAVPDLAPIADWILKHHEWWNGQGYPLGLKGEEIPLECRILAIADAYDSMTNGRPYRRAMTHDEAVAELKKGAGRQFDPRLVEVFLGLLDGYTMERTACRQARTGFSSKPGSCGCR